MDIDGVVLFYPVITKRGMLLCVNQLTLGGPPAMSGHMIGYLANGMDGTVVWYGGRWLAMWIIDFYVPVNPSMLG